MVVFTVMKARGSINVNCPEMAKFISYILCSQHMCITVRQCIHLKKMLIGCQLRIIIGDCAYTKIKGL